MERKPEPIATNASTTNTCSTSKLQEDAHARIAAVAHAQSCKSSSLINGLSRHNLPITVSFANLSALHAIVKDCNKLLPQNDFVGTSGKELFFSSKFNFVVPDVPTQPNGVLNCNKGKKRQREYTEDLCNQMAQARKRIADAQAVPKIPTSEIDTAQDVLTRVVRDVRGPAGEILVQSYAMIRKKLRSDDARPRLVLAIRMNAGIAVPITQLKRALGDCWKDGCVSAESSVQGVCDTDLPLTDEASASMTYGNMPMLIVTSVPFEQAQEGVESVRGVAET